VVKQRFFASLRLGAKQICTINQQRQILLSSQVRKSLIIHNSQFIMVANSLLWTIRDLDVMPDDGGWKRYEIIDGELYVTRAPHIRHQDAGGNIHVELAIWSRQTQLGKPFQTPGIIFTPTDAVIPDVVWISSERLNNGIDEAGHLTVAPELIVEILSPGEGNERRDKEVKLKLYSLKGVQEYWIVSWQLKTIEIYRRRDAQLQLVSTLLVTDTLTSPLLPGFSTPVAQIFE
jgi:Uma2 family endonuclease